MAILEAGRRAMRRGLARFPWTGPSPAQPADGRRGPRIAVVGNCQARGLARCLAILLPDARITHMPIGRLGRAGHAPKAFAEALRPFDHVFLQPVPGREGPDERLAGLPRARFFPAIVFSAFHPDMVYVGDLAARTEAALVPSPLQTYHSAIALFGHLRGLSPERIAGLFREEVLAALGYLDGWASSAQDLAGTSRAIGFDLGPDLTRWSRRGAFMHGINHPKLFVLADVAARLAREAGLAPAEVNVEAYLVDDLLDDVIWPVYPAVAGVYGLPGSYAFKRRARPGTGPEILCLDGFVTESLAIYRGMPAARLTCHRVELWSGIPEIRELFDRG